MRLPLFPLFSVVAVVNCLRIEGDSVQVHVDPETFEAYVDIVVVNDGKETIDVALNFNQTLPGDSVGVSRSSRSGAIEPVTPDEHAIGELVARSAQEVVGGNGPTTLTVVIDPEDESLKEKIVKLKRCLEAHGTDCEHISWRADSKCFPRVHVMRHIGVVELFYDETLSECTQEDIADDIKFIGQHFHIVSVAADEKLPEEHPEITEVNPEIVAQVAARSSTTIPNPNDPDFYRQWGMTWANITGAWAEIGGWPENFTPVVAVIDTGSYMNHPDLLANYWVNEAELNGKPGVDDDGNGYIDDIYGWTSQAKTGMLPDDINGHGTHCAGIIGAVPNNGIGVAGVAGPNVKLAICRRYGPNLENTQASAAECSDWALSINAHITSNSYGLADTAPGRVIWSGKKAAYEAFLKKRVPLFFAAMNDGKSLGPVNRQLYVYDACWDYPNILSVSNMRSNEQLQWDSNYGETCVEMGAPGTGIWNTGSPTVEGTLYVDKSGTSMATPFMAGVGALLLNVNPYLDSYDMRRVLREAIRPVGALARPNTLWGGFPDPVTAIRLLRPQNLKPADGSRWDDLRFKLRRLNPGEKTTYSLQGKLEEHDGAYLGDFVAYNVDGAKNYLVKGQTAVNARVLYTPKQAETTESPPAVNECPPCAARKSH